MEGKQYDDYDTISVKDGTEVRTYEASSSELKAKITRLLDEEYQLFTLETLLRYVPQDVDARKKVIHFHFPNMTVLLHMINETPNRPTGIIRLLKEEDVQKYIPQTKLRLETDDACGIFLTSVIFTKLPSEKVERRLLIHYYAVL